MHIYIYIYISDYKNYTWSYVGIYLPEMIRKFNYVKILLKICCVCVCVYVCVCIYIYIYIYTHILVLSND